MLRAVCARAAAAGASLPQYTRRRRRARANPRAAAAAALAAAVDAVWALLLPAFSSLIKTNARQLRNATLTLLSRQPLSGRGFARVSARSKRKGRERARAR